MSAQDNATELWVRNPQNFMQQHAVHALKIFTTDIAIPGGQPTSGYIRLVYNKDTTNYEIRYVGQQHEQGTTFGYILGYHAGAQTRRTPAFVDIPSKPPVGTFLVTGGLSGCSVIATKLNDNTYRVFHDSRQDSSVLYDNVQMAIDWKNYSLGDGILATVCMQYQERGWVMITQYQNPVPGRPDAVQIRPPRSSGLADRLNISLPGSYNTEAERKNLTERRERLLADLQFLVRNNFGTELQRQPDGPFEPFQDNKISLTNQGVSGSQALIREAEDIYNSLLANLEHTAQENPAAAKALRSITFKPVWKAVVSQCQGMDWAYLWLQQRLAKGYDAVVVTDGRLEARMEGELEDILGEEFASLEFQKLQINHPDFVKGFQNYTGVEIPGLANGMTSRDMKALFIRGVDSGRLTNREQGALLRRIGIASTDEYRASVWGKTERIVKLFQDAGAAAITPMPQDLILGAIHDEYGGRCYPLVRAMSVALSQSDFAVQQLGIRLVALKTDKQLLEASIFRRALNGLHSSYPAATASTLIGRKSLEGAVERLVPGDGGRAKVFALNTSTHSMLLAATEYQKGEVKYHFYDPNFAIVSFASREQLLQSLKKFIIDEGFGKTYGAFGTTGEPQFNLVEVNTEMMEKIPLDYGLNVGQLGTDEELGVLSHSMAIEKLDLPRANRFSKDQYLSAGDKLMEGFELAEAWHAATTKLEQSVGLGSNWMPVLASLETQNNNYRIQFMNLDNPNETRWISTSDPEFREFREFLDSRLKPLRDHFEYNGDRFEPRKGMSEGETIDGINTMLLIKTIIEHFSKRERGPGGTTISNHSLATAIQLHSYLNLTQIGQQSLNDVSKMIELTRTIIRSEEAAHESLSTIIRAFNGTMEAAGVALGAANVILDAYELSQAESEIQKAVFSTQLAFDSASLLAGAGSIGAGMMGAASIAAVLGGVGVILGGLAFGFGALAENYGKIAQDAQAVGRYFGETEDAYNKGGYRYEANNKVLVPLPGAVIKKLDLDAGLVFPAGRIDFDSQYIYRTHHGATGSGHINYFFWLGDFPKMDSDRSHAINIREGIGAPSNGSLPRDTIKSFTTLILPATPKSYISYEYMTLPFATSRHDYGFDIIRRLEDLRDYPFDFDFYIFPSEYIIRRIFHEYVHTPVDVALDNRNMRIQMPSLPEAMRGKLEYTLTGSGADYTIGVNTETSRQLTLKTKVLAIGTRKTRWILDCRQVEDYSLTVEKDGVYVSGRLQVHLADDRFESMFVLAKSGDVLLVDFKNLSAKAVAENASQWPGSGASLEQHLNDLNSKHLLQGEYIVVNDYAAPTRNNPNVSFRVGRAYYQTAQRRMLYTLDAPEQLTGNAMLGAVIGNDVYFYNEEKNGIWLVDATTRRCKAKYKPLFYSASMGLLRVWLEDNTVHAAYRHKLKSGGEGELTYIITTEEMTLAGIVGDDELLRRLKTMDHVENGVMPLLTAYRDDSESPTLIDSLEGVTIHANADALMVSIFGLTKESPPQPHRYWLRFPYGDIIKPAFTPPYDLVLAGSLPSVPGRPSEEFYFFSPQEQKIYLQTGTGTTTSQVQTISIPPQFQKLRNVINVDGNLFAITDTGFVLRVTSAGTLFLEAVNRQWLIKQQESRLKWWDELRKLSETNGASTISVLGIENTNKVVVPVWYHHGRIVVASDVLHRQQLQLVSVREDGSESFICQWDSPDHGQLYRQPLLTMPQLTSLLNNPVSPIDSSKVPAASLVQLGDNAIQSLSVTGTGLQCTTTKGVTFTLKDRDTAVVAVSKEWQESHLDTLTQSLADLTNTWPHGEVVILQGTPKATPAWYHVNSRGIMRLRSGATWEDRPMWIGTSLVGDKVHGHVFLLRNGMVHIIEPDTVRTHGPHGMVTRFGKGLSYLRPPEVGLTIPAIQGVHHVMSTASAKPDSGSLTIDQSAWEHYQSIVFLIRTKPDTGRNQGIVFQEWTDSILVYNIEDDLVLADTGRERSITVRKGYGTDSRYSKVDFIPSERIPIETIKKTAEWLQGLLKRSTIPGVTLTAVREYLATHK